jgi:signal transduction histidine kinase
MSYRSFNPLIGDTSLERKCRLLFVACLLLLISFAFVFVERITVNRVRDATIAKARGLAEAGLLRLHFVEWAGAPEDAGPRRDAKGLATELSRDLQSQEHEWELLALEPTAYTERPADAQEEGVLRQLKQELLGQIRTLATSSPGERLAGQPGNPDAPPPPSSDRHRTPAVDLVAPVTDVSSPIDIEAVYHYQAVPKSEKICYYQPVYWKSSCSRCHEGFESFDSFPKAQAAMMFDEGTFPFRVMKVTFPGRKTQDAITWIRVLLLTIGIITVFVAMIFLWVIFHFVVVKPLKHLGDVSDAISRGNTELRAEIHTNDEFEELANAFNRMLRHLTDTQSELRHVNQDLDAKLDQLAQLNMQLYEMNRLKSDFLANMSHELRTPLHSIIGFSEVLQGVDTLTDKQKRYAQNIQKSGRQLLDLINDILDLAKIEAGKMDLRPTEFHIGAVVHAQCDLVRALSAEKNIDVNAEVEVGLPEIYQDRNKVQQILMNLLSNAIKFTPEGGRITVGARRDQERLVLTVADTGVGIAEEDRDIIFEKFRQSSRTIGDGNLTREYSGTGLGLSIVKELCKLLGGEIRFESALGRGSTFFVSLPWFVPHPMRRESHLEAQLDELTKTQRLEQVRAEHPAEPPVPAAS